MWQWFWIYVIVKYCWLMYICLLLFRFNLYDLLVRLAQYAHLLMVLMGDFNAVLDAVLDSSNPNRLSSSDLISWASVARLLELWHWKHPADRCFSHISTAHRSSARIDMAFGNGVILPFLTDIEYLAGGLSDHNPLSLTLTFSTGAKKGGWRLSPSWRNQVILVL